MHQRYTHLSVFARQVIGLALNCYILSQITHDNNYNNINLIKIVCGNFLNLNFNHFKSVKIDSKQVHVIIINYTIYCWVSTKSLYTTLCYT